MSILGQAITVGGGGSSASIKVTGDIHTTDTCYATKGGVQKNAAWASVPNPAYRDLPSGYTQVECINSNGSQYIDTGIFADTLTRVECGIRTNTFDANHWIWGAYEQKTQTINSCIGASMHGTDSDKAILAFGDSGHGDKIIYTNSFTNEQPIHMVSGAIKIDSEIFAADFGDMPHLSVVLFGLNYQGSKSGNASCSIYSFKMYSGNSAVIDLVPCKNSNNVYGMYDLVSRTFFANQGTGVFTGGNETTQYIHIWLINGISKLGTWTVNWSDGSRVTERNVLIDAISEYGVENIERLYLYNEGDECTALTGGIGSTGWARDGFEVVNVSKETDYIRVYTGQSGKIGMAGTLDSIDITHYDRISIMTDDTTALGGVYLGVTICPNKSAFGTDRLVSAEQTTGGMQINTYNISSGSGNYYFGVYSQGITDSKLYKIWLE